MTVCAIGGQPIDGPARRVFTTTHPAGVTVCVGHGIAYEFADRAADALADELGETHPFVLQAQEALDALLNCPCPTREQPPMAVGDLPPASEIPPPPAGVAA